MAHYNLTNHNSYRMETEGEECRIKNEKNMLKLLNIVTCRGVGATKRTGSISDDWTYLHLGYDISPSHSLQRSR
jgi:hypothetical protein